MAKASLSWVSSSGQGIAYRVYLSQNEGARSVVAEIPAGAGLGYESPELEAGHYAYDVVGVVDGQESNPSNTVALPVVDIILSGQLIP